jgi:hypothetical protein
VNKGASNEKSPPARRDGFLGVCSGAIETLFSGDALRQIRDNRQFEVFALISLDHKENPENKRGQVDQMKEQNTWSEKVKPARKQANPEKNSQGDADDMETPEDNDRLRGMEFNGGRLSMRRKMMPVSHPSA